MLIRHGRCVMIVCFRPVFVGASENRATLTRDMSHMRELRAGLKSGASINPAKFNLGRETVLVCARVSPPTARPIGVRVLLSAGGSNRTSSYSK